MIEIGSKKIKSLTTEFTIDEFEAVSFILNDAKLMEIERFIKAFEFLGADKREIDEFSFEEFGGLVKKFDKRPKAEKGLVQEIEIDGYKYKAYAGESFKLFAKDMGAIEKIVKNSPKKHLAEIIAVLFKREDLTGVEHYAEAHIKHKAKLIREAGIKASIAVPYLVIVAQQLAKTTKTNLLKKANEVETA